MLTKRLRSQSTIQKSINIEINGLIMPSWHAPAMYIIGVQRPNGGSKILQIVAPNQSSALALS